MAHPTAMTDRHDGEGVAQGTQDTLPIDAESAAEEDFWKRPARVSEPPESTKNGVLPPLRWKKNVVLFVLTTLSVFINGALYETKGLHPFSDPIGMLRALPSGWRFAVPLMSILLVHEFGHFFAARYHRVPASLPFFIPLPLLSPFGTMGAVIGMRGRIRSRNALLDIGASGPLAGLIVAIPVIVIGLMQSPVKVPEPDSWQEGQSLLYLLLKRVVIGPIPDGRDVMLSPIAFAGWSGLFVTALNLLPVGQLDGGHVAYALFGPKQNKIARVIHWSLLLVFVYNMVQFMGPVVRTQRWEEADRAFSNSMFWLMWFGLLFLLGRLGGKDHPPTDPGELSAGRKVIAVITLIVFLLLFMPTPLAVM
ncbi:MAG: site-2 protease family protein [Polyangiaceae bacterium]|nr:site-2 protease family protein [Polyangiaceae bacterium]